MAGGFLNDERFCSWGMAGCFLNDERFCSLGMAGTWLNDEPIFTREEIEMYELILLAAVCDAILWFAIVRGYGRGFPE